MGPSNVFEFSSARMDTLTISEEAALLYGEAANEGGLAGC
jgi:hypothetical protein